MLSLLADVDDMKEIVSKLEYARDRIKTTYFYRPDLPLEELLVVIESKRLES